MSRVFVFPGLLIDSWRDQPQTEPGEMNLPGGAIPISRFRGTSDDVTSTPRLMRMIALAASKWESR